MQTAIPDIIRKQQSQERPAKDKAIEGRTMSLETAAPFSLSSPSPLQRKENRSGLPDNLKAGVEKLSGYSMDDVTVHYNSAKPAILQAHAYAQGTDIHLGPGQEKHLPHEAWHVVQQKQGRVKATAQLRSAGAGNEDVVQRKVFLFSGGVNTPLTEGAKWFATKSSDLAPSDPALYLDGVKTSFPDHVIVDMMQGGSDFDIRPGETAIIVAHGAMGGGPGSFSDDNSNVVTPAVLKAIHQIIVTNQKNFPLRIFVAACNSAREHTDLKQNVGESPIKHIIDTLGLHDLVAGGQVIFEGYTAQAGLSNYGAQHVGEDKKGTHIWGKNKATPTGKINDNKGGGQQIFGYDTSVTARAHIGMGRRVGFSQQSVPRGNFNMGLDEIHKNQGLYDTMLPTSVPQQSQISGPVPSSSMDDGSHSMQVEDDLPTKEDLHKSVLSEAERFGADQFYEIGFADGTDNNCSIISIFKAAGVDISREEAAEYRQQLGITGGGNIDLTPQVAQNILNLVTARTQHRYTLYVVHEGVRQDPQAPAVHGVTTLAGNGGTSPLFIFFAGTHFSPAWHH